MSEQKPNMVAGRYRVIRELGRGGMGVVYVVEHVHTGETLALKLLQAPVAQQPEAVARFKREARASAKIRSEHVVRVTDADVAPELGGAPFLVMELLEGVDLEALAKKRGRLRAETVVAALADVARALDKAHQLGIVHRDLKPENLFLHRKDDGTAIVKILDFGISKFAHEELEVSKLLVTVDGAMMGTPYYMAPEQAQGHVNEIRAATDGWAIGLIAMRLLMAEPYWTARTLPELISQIVVSPLTLPSVRWNVSTALDAWFQKACSRKPAERFTTVSEQVHELANGLGIALAGLDVRGILSAELRDELGNAPPSRAGKAPQAELDSSVPSTTTAAHLARTDTQLAPPTPPKRFPLALAGAGAGAVLALGLGYAWFSWRGSSAVAPELANSARLGAASEGRPPSEPSGRGAPPSASEAPLPAGSGPVVSPVREATGTMSATATATTSATGASSVSKVPRPGPVPVPIRPKPPGPSKPVDPLAP